MKKEVTNILTINATMVAWTVHKIWQSVKVRQENSKFNSMPERSSRVPQGMQGFLTTKLKIHENNKMIIHVV